MLEAKTLLVRSWEADARAVLDAATGMPVGTIRRRPLTNLWRRLLHVPALAAFETEDESLLFTLQRFWRFSSRWNVVDSEGAYVGCVIRFRHIWPHAHIGHGPFSGWVLLDRIDRALGYVRSGAAVSECWDVEGRTVGAIESVDQGERISMPEEWNPFARMLLVSTLLLREDSRPNPAERSLAKADR